MGVAPGADQLGEALEPYDPWDVLALLGRNLLYERLMLDMSQKSLAMECRRRGLRMSQQWIDEIEKGRIDMRIGTLVKFANVLRKEPKFLLDPAMSAGPARSELKPPWGLVLASGKGEKKCYPQLEAIAFLNDIE